MSGGSMSPTFGSSTDGCIWWRRSTGIRGKSFPGNLITPWRCPFFWTVWTGLSLFPRPQFGIATREATLQAPAIWSDLRPRRFKSAWMEKAEPSTIFSPSDSGEASNTKRFTSMNINLPRKLEREFSPGLPSITGKDLTSPWGTRLPGRSYTRPLLRDRATKTSLLRLETTSSKMCLQKS